MRVLHLFSTYLPKTQTWAFNLLRFTPEAEIFVGSLNYHPDSWWDEHFTEVRKGVPKSVSQFKEKVVYQLLSKDKREVRRLRKTKHLIRNVWAPAIEKEGIDLVHVHFADTGWDYLELKRLTGVPYVVSFYGMDYEFIPYHKPEFIERYQELIAEADGILCEGPHGKKILVEHYGAEPAKIAVVPLGVEVDEIPFYTRKKKEGQLNLVQIASFVEKKGHEFTIRAFAKALEQCPDMNLTLVGKGPLLEEMKRLVEDLEVKDQVNFEPFIDYALLSEYLRAFDVFIHPSCYSKERDCEGGAPVVLLDAQATGMPVIATTHCDIPAEVVDGKTGRLVGEKDIPALSRAIIEFYNMAPEAYHEYASSARVHVLKNFSVKQNAGLNLSTYKGILEGKKKPR